jgi:hypothetical protein
METVKASVVEVDGKHYILFVTADGEIKIPISDDNPNEVKSAFNKLIERIKEGEFEIEMDEVGPDLFSQVASEYLTQLNREIKEVRKEMEDIGLVGQGD